MRFSIYEKRQLEPSWSARALVCTTWKAWHVRPRPRAWKLEMGRKREREKEERGTRRLERLHPAGARRCTVATLENALIAM